MEECAFLSNCVNLVKSHVGDAHGYGGFPSPPDSLTIMASDRSADKQACNEASETVDVISSKQQHLSVTPLRYSSDACENELLALNYTGTIPLKLELGISSKLDVSHTDGLRSGCCSIDGYYGYQEMTSEDSEDDNAHSVFEDELLSYYFSYNENSELSLNVDFGSPARDLLDFAKSHSLYEEKIEVEERLSNSGTESCTHAPVNSVVLTPPPDYTSDFVGSSLGLTASISLHNEQSGPNSRSCSDSSDHSWSKTITSMINSENECNGANSAETENRSAEEVEHVEHVVEHVQQHVLEDVTNIQHPTSEDPPQALDSKLRQSMESLAGSEFKLTEVHVLDISCIPEAVNFIWTTGRLPPWIQCFPNLDTLYASNLGIFYVDKWIVNLQKLHTLILDRNCISTWPHHLVKIPNLKVLCLDGNPCLEKLFSKSPTFRCVFFRQQPRGGLSVQPKEIAGPEWKPARARRAVTSSAQCLQGFYCGGIYTLSTPPQYDDLITPLEPCELLARLKIPPPVVEPDREPTRRLSSTSWTRIAGNHALVMSLLKDIDILLSPVDTSTEQMRMTLACKAIPPWKPMDHAYLVDRIAGFVLAEGIFCSTLSEVIHIFFRPGIKAAIARELRIVFDGFPELYRLHTTVFQPLFKGFLECVRQNNPEKVNAYQKHIYDVMSEHVSQYETYGGQYVRGMRALWRSTLEDVGDFENEMIVWIEEQKKSPLHSLQDANRYLTVPLDRLNEYHSFFARLVSNFPGLAPVANLLRQIKERTADKIHNARCNLRAMHLGITYQVPDGTFCNYRWDVSIGIRTRCYMERPIYQYNTADVVDNRGLYPKPLSVVKEIYKWGERILRMVCCGDALQLWDDGLKEYIGQIKVKDMLVERYQEKLPVDVEAECNSLVRIRFLSLDETCVGFLKEFNGVHQGGDNNLSNFFMAASISRESWKFSWQRTDGLCI